MTVAVIAGGSERPLTLAELEWAAEALRDRSVTTVRIGASRSIVSGWIVARELALVEGWRTPIRSMLSGQRSEQIVPEPVADFVLRFDDAPVDAVVAAFERGLHVHYIHHRPEPRIWNRHHGDPPGPWVYCGRGSPVGNVTYSYEHYRDWLRSRITKSPDFDPAVVDWIRKLAPETYVVCSCWPRHCHAEWIVRAWRWLQPKDTQ